MMEQGDDARRLAAPMERVYAMRDEPTVRDAFRALEAAMIEGRAAPGGATRLAEPTVCRPIRSARAMRST